MAGLEDGGHTQDCDGLPRARHPQLHETSEWGDSPAASLERTLSSLSFSKGAGMTEVEGTFFRVCGARVQTTECGCEVGA